MAREPPTPPPDSPGGPPKGGLNQGDVNNEGIYNAQGVVAGNINGSNTIIGTSHGRIYVSLCVETKT